uniref:Putative ovule protein n=1 Tax=Solanum chacoense TaxID=4108 RepID=A0A0V0GST0_SOLCH
MFIRDFCTEPLRLELLCITLLWYASASFATEILTHFMWFFNSFSTTKLSNFLENLVLPKVYRNTHDFDPSFFDFHGVWKASQHHTPPS